MELVTTIYAIVGGMTFLGLGLIVVVIAGKAIFFEFTRRMIPKGVDIFMVNSSRHVSHHYKVPKEGIFNIKGKIYITNPDKLMGLSDDMVEEAKLSVIRQNNKLQARIDDFKSQIELVKDEIKNTKEDDPVILQLKAYLASLEEKKGMIEKSMEGKEQLYYNRQRGCFFFIEGDPIPKDFYELYTHMDSSAIDNVIARSMTKDPKAVKNMEKEIKLIKFLIILTLIAAAAAAILAVTLKTDLLTIAQNLNIDLTI